MKKTLFLSLLICSAISLLAQRDTASYYYKGKRTLVDVTYQQLIVGLKNAPASRKSKSLLAGLFGISADSVKATNKQNQFIIPAGNRKDDATVKAAVLAQRKNESIAFIHPCLLSPSGKLVSYADEFVIKARPGTTYSLMTALIARYNCRLIKKYPFANNIYIITATGANGYDALKMANVFFETGFFEYAEPDFVVHHPLAEAPNDPLYNLQWALKNTGSPEQYNGVPGADMNVDSAWLVTKGDASIKIAVIDTGVDTAQADLKDNLLQGFDCTTLTSNPGDGAPKSSNNGHGTACAGIIAAVADNNIGIAGIAPKCKIIPINIADENNFFVSDIGQAAGFDYAWQNGADVISNSWYGGLPSGLLDDAIHKAVTLGRNGKGSIVLFATGNDNGGISYPASNPDVIAVGGVNMCNQRKSPNSCDGEGFWGANYGDGLDVVAPCVKIATTDISGTGGYNQDAFGNGDYYNAFNGTSSACPNAAGVAALILSANSNLTAKEARIVLENSCTKVPGYSFAMTEGNPNGTWNSEVGYGRVNAYQAVKAAQSGNFCNVMVNASGPLMLCKGDLVTLKIIDPVKTAVYAWRLNGVSNETIDSSLVVAAAGVYDVVATYANGCIAVSTPLTVTGPGAENLHAFAGDEVTICVGGNGARIGGMPSASGGMPFINSRRGYGIETFLGNGLMRFNPDKPGEYDFKPLLESNEVNDRSFYVGDFTPLGYYTLTRNGNLIRIDTATGAQTFIATLKPEQGENYGQNWAGMAWDPSTQKMYVITNGLYSNRLYTVDLTDGSLIAGPQLKNNAIGWIAFNKAGTLFGYLLDPKFVMRINKYTGEIYGNASQEAGVNMFLPLDGGVDPLNGKIYLSTFYVLQKITNDIRVIDTLTGKVTVTGTIGNISQVSALAISDGVYRYSWSPSAGLSNAEDANPVANPEKTTVYTLTVSDFCGDTAVSSIKVIAGTSPPPIEITAERDSICVGDTVRLSATQNSSYHYQWMLYDKDIPGANDSFYVARRMGDFHVRVTNGRGGCKNTSALFRVKDCSIILNNNNTDTTCYGYFYPSQGLQEKAWLPNESWTKTIYPATPGGRLGIRFSSFSSRSIQDRLTIYDGPNTASPIIRSFTLGNNPWLNYDYYSATGPLTFEFTSGPTENNAGNWDAFLTCYQSKVYRSKQSGNFEDASTWQVKDGAGYIDATAMPTYLDDSITIQTGHTVTLANSTANQFNQLWIQKGAKLVCSKFLQLRDEPGFELVADGDIDILNDGAILGEGTTVLIRGNINGTINSINATCYIDGDTPQNFSFKNIRFDSLIVLNNASLSMQGAGNIRYLQMNTGGGLSLDSTFNIERELVLDKGIINVKNTQLFKFTDGAKLTGGNKNSFINGTVYWPLLPYVGTFDFAFPIGYDTDYKPLVLHTTRRSYYNGQQLKITAIKGAPLSRRLPAGIGRVSDINYHRVEATKSDTSAIVTITLPYNNEDNVTDTAALRIVKDDAAGNWINLGGTGSGKDTGTITSDSSFRRFGDFALAYTSGTLPVNWISFQALLKGKAAQLTWKVASELNLAYYTTEHSTDGIHFTTLAKLQPQEGNSPAKTYQWLHLAPAQGLNYYRIKQVDKDGHFSYSKIEKLQLYAGSGYTVTPNPAGREIVITAVDLIKEINFYDMQGRLLKTVKPSALQYKMALAYLPAGTYNLRIITVSQVYNTKVLKQ